MRSYEETIRRVHSRIALYEAKQKTKHARIAGAAAAVTPVCLAAAVGIGVWRSGACSPAEIRQTGEVPVTPVTETAVSARMGLDKLRRHMATGAEYITGPDSSCLMHMQGVARKQGLDIKFIHVAQILSSGL